MTAGFPLQNYKKLLYSLDLTLFDSSVCLSDQQWPSTIALLETLPYPIGILLDMTANQLEEKAISYYNYLCKILMDTFGGKAILRQHHSDPTKLRYVITIIVNYNYICLT